MQVATEMTPKKKINRGGAPVGNTNGAKPWLEPTRVMQVYLTNEEKEFLEGVSEGLKNMPIGTIISKAIDQLMKSRKQPPRDVYSGDSEHLTGREVRNTRVSVRVRETSAKKLIELAPKRGLKRSEFIRIVVCQLISGDIKL